MFVRCCKRINERLFRFVAFDIDTLLHGAIETLLKDPEAQTVDALDNLFESISEDSHEVQVKFHHRPLVTSI